MQIPNESGMTFGDFCKENCFWVEKSKLYNKSLKHLGFKSVEFVLYQEDASNNDNKLLFVEAKTSLRIEDTANKFSAEITNISQKFMDSLQLICGAWHGGRRDSVPLPANFSKFYDAGKRIVFLLVVKTINKDDLLIVKDTISRQLLKERRLWQFDVWVLDEELAVKEELILKCSNGLT